MYRFSLCSVQSECNLVWHFSDPLYPKTIQPFSAFCDGHQSKIQHSSLKPSAFRIMNGMSRNLCRNWPWSRLCQDCACVRWEGAGVDLVWFGRLLGRAPVSLTVFPVQLICIILRLSWTWARPQIIRHLLQWNVTCFEAQLWPDNGAEAVSVSSARLEWSQWACTGSGIYQLF